MLQAWESQPGLMDIGNHGDTLFSIYMYMYMYLVAFCMQKELVYLSTCTCIYLSALYMYLSIILSIYLHNIYIHLSINLSIYVHVSIYTVSIYLITCIYLSVYVRVHVYTCIFCLFIYQSVCLSTMYMLSMHLFIYACIQASIHLHLQL